MERKKQFYGFDLFGDLNFDEPVSKKLLIKIFHILKDFRMI